MVKWDVDYTKFERMEDPEPPEEVYYDKPMDPEGAMSLAYESEMVRDRPADKVREMQIQLAMDTYERRRPKDKVLHHYVIKDAGDPDALGDYLPTQETRNDCPVYRNAKGISLSREKQPTENSSGEQYGWILGSIQERRPLYGVMSDDLSVPTQGWQSFTAIEPVPTIRYYTAATASKMYNEKGKKAVQAKEWAEAEGWYSKALETGMDPNEYLEPMGIVYSNRAEVRLRMLNYEGAQADAAAGLRYLKPLPSEDAATKLLMQKTYVRGAKAHAGMLQFLQASSFLKEAALRFPSSEEVAQTEQEMDVALRGEPRIKYLNEVVGQLRSRVRAASDDELASYSLPGPLTKAILRVQYLFLKAEAMDGDGKVYSDLKTVFRANGGLRLMLHIARLQWKSNVEGQYVDLFKMEGLSNVAMVVALACQGCPENLKIAANEAQCFFGALGGCNRKVGADVCDKLISLASGLWGHAVVASNEAVQNCSVVVERAAIFLAKAVLAEPGDAASGPDAPELDADARAKALALLSTWLGAGGRLEKRAARGAATQLASFDGTGFFTTGDTAVGDIGALVLQKVIADPSLVASPAELGGLVVGARLLMACGPTSEEARGAKLPALEYGPPGTSLRYAADWEDWAGSEDGAKVIKMLEAIARVLEHRLLLRSHELDKDDYIAAFVKGGGWLACAPLVQAPAALAVPAVHCLAVMAQVSEKFAADVGRLGVVGALLGAPTPASDPMPSAVGRSLGSSAPMRRGAARIFAACSLSDTFADLLRRESESMVKALAKLTFDVSLDSCKEAVFDMVCVFLAISNFNPGVLCQHASDDLLTMLVDFSRSGPDSPLTPNAESIIRSLKRDRKTGKRLEHITERAEAGVGADVEEELVTRARDL